MKVPDDLHYQESHEWHRVEGEMVTIGITQYAADELTDITYVELPKVGAEVRAGTAFGEIESVKATADLNSGVSGRVVEVNGRLAEEPELVNNDPYGEGWMIRVQLSESRALEKLLPAGEYTKLIVA